MKDFFFFRATSALLCAVVASASQRTAATLRKTSYSYPGVIERLDHWSTSTQTQSRVLQVVTHRELFLGCYSFEEYLSPLFHTLIVLPKDIVMALKVNEIAADDASVTAGLHIFMTDNKGTAGSSYARMIGEQFIAKELETLGIDIGYIQSINCDAHEFPTNHSNYVSTEQLTLRMERDFDLIKKYRDFGNNIETDYDSNGYPFDAKRNRCSHGCSNPTPLARLNILDMNSIIFEDVSIDSGSTELGKFHGADIGDWWGNGGWEIKPKNLTNACLPWIVDMSKKFEDHVIMFDIEILRSVKKQYFAVSLRSFPDEKNFIGEFALKNNFTLIRHNDVAFNINFGHHPKFMHYPTSLDVDWFKMRNLEELAEHRNPLELQANWHRVHEFTDVKTVHSPWTQFLFMHIRKSTWLPRSLDKPKKMTNPRALKVIMSVLKCCGYTLKGEYDGMFLFEIDRVYPGTRLVSFNSAPGMNKPFVKLHMPNNNTDITLYIDSLKTGPPAVGLEYKLEIPAIATVERNGFLIRE